MPQIAASLHTGEGAIQFSLMSFFGGMMIGQLFFGPLSDRFGRKPLIYIGLLIFIIGSLGSAMATTAGQLTAWRLAQGVGGSMGMAIGFAVVRDLYTGRTAVSLIALMMIVQGIAPIIGPLLGTGILALAPWPTIFEVLAAFGAICIALVALGLPETRLKELRTASHPIETVRNYLRLSVSRDFIPYVAVMALAQGGFFAYLSASSFVFISLYGLTPTVYSVIFAVNSLGLMAGAQASARLMRYVRAETMVKAAILVYTIAAVLLTALAWWDHMNVFMLSLLLFVVITAMAFVMSLGGVLAMEAHGAISGTASALMGALRFGAGVLASFAVGVMANGTALPMVATVALCGIAGCIVAFATFVATPQALRGE